MGREGGKERDRDWDELFVFTIEMKFFLEKLWINKDMHESSIIFFRFVMGIFSYIDIFPKYFIKILGNTFHVKIKESRVRICQLITGIHTQYLNFLYSTFILQFAINRWACIVYMKSFKNIVAICP